MAFAGIGVICLAAVAGCDGTSNSRVAPVTGTVQFDGKPVEGATVTFFSDMATRVAMGKTDASGRFELYTDGYGMGCEPGICAVQVFKKSPDGRDLLPARYAGGFSTLKYDVDMNKENHFDIVLQDATAPADERQGIQPNLSADKTTQE